MLDVKRHVKHTILLHIILTRTTRIKGNGILGRKIFQHTFILFHKSTQLFRACQISSRDSILLRSSSVHKFSKLIIYRLNLIEDSRLTNDLQSHCLRESCLAIHMSHGITQPLRQTSLDLSLVIYIISRSMPSPKLLTSHISAQTCPINLFAIFST